MDILIRTSHPDTSTTVNVGIRTHTFDTKAAALLAVAMYLDVKCSLVAPPTAGTAEGANLHTPNKPIMPVCPHAKVKWVVCDCGIKGELAYDFLDCNGEGTYSVPGNNGFGYSRQCGKVAPGKPS